MRTIPALVLALLVGCGVEDLTSETQQASSSGGGYFILPDYPDGTVPPQAYLDVSLGEYADIFTADYVGGPVTPQYLTVDPVMHRARSANFYAASNRARLVRFQTNPVVWTSTILQIGEERMVIPSYGRAAGNRFHFPVYKAYGMYLFVGNPHAGPVRINLRSRTSAAIQFIDVPAERVAKIQLTDSNTAYEVSSTEVVVLSLGRFNGKTWDVEPLPNG